MAKGFKTGGRTQGTPNKATATLKEAAREYTEQALAVLVKVATEGESEAARVSAANAILDRGYGKPMQHVEGNIGLSLGQALDALDAAD